MVRVVLLTIEYEKEMLCFFLKKKTNRNTMLFIFNIYGHQWMMIRKWDGYQSNDVE
jgi:hypothetical protein